MGIKFKHWLCGSEENAKPSQLEDLKKILLNNRSFQTEIELDYGDHGLEDVKATILAAMKANKHIALYADYDVDGTMSCVSWAWFFRAVNYQNYSYYIPCRFSEGYGLNLEAVEHLIDDRKAELIITMDTGITANTEAAYCKSRGVEFICTDHHVIQQDKMPDCKVLNPKMHPDENFQELCGCGITFVLLRKLGQEFDVAPKVWRDLLALCGMATICDLVPLNPVNHKLARSGVLALSKSDQPTLRALMKAGQVDGKVDETDVGFRLGPRINAVGRLAHAELIVEAFMNDEPTPLVKKMDELNNKRKLIQAEIINEANEQARPYADDPILFLGGEWHQGVVGIAASKIVENYWRPTWLFRIDGDECKGSARSIPGFDVTAAMQSCPDLFDKFGGHTAAAGYSFKLKNLEEIRDALCNHAIEIFEEDPQIWESKTSFDCELPGGLLGLQLFEVLDELKPFGMGFESPRFKLKGQLTSLRHYNDKQTGEPKHTCFEVMIDGDPHKVVFFNDVFKDIQLGSELEFIVSVDKNKFRGRTSLSLFGKDFRAVS